MKNLMTKLISWAVTPTGGVFLIAIVLLVILLSGPVGSLFTWFGYESKDSLRKQIAVLQVENKTYKQEIAELNRFIEINEKVRDIKEEVILDYENKNYDIDNLIDEVLRPKPEPKVDPRPNTNDILDPKRQDVINITNIHTVYNNLFGA